MTIPDVTTMLIDPDLPKITIQRKDIVSVRNTAAPIAVEIIFFFSIPVIVVHLLVSCK